MAGWLAGFGKELMFAARRLTRAPGFTITAVVTLALAIGANVAIFVVVEPLAAVPGVAAVSASSCLPLAAGCFGNTVRVRGREMPPNTRS